MVDKLFSLVVRACILLVLGITVSACDSGADIDDDLQNTEWFLVQLRNNPPIKDRQIRLTFTDTRIEGASGCNSFFTDETVVMEDGETSIAGAEISRTLVDCAENIMEQEREFFDLLGEAVAYQVTDDRLELYDDTGSILLAFTKS